MSAALLLFARHEGRLAWRDSLARLAAGRRGSLRWLPAAVLVFEAVAHTVAYAILAPVTASLLLPDKGVLLVVTGSLLMPWTLFLSQAMETATRGFYTRGDLDLVLSSPAPARQVFAVRIVAIAASTVGMAALVAAPAIDVAAWLGGARFLLGYGVLVAMGASAAAVAVCLTLALFAVFGPKRTRLLAQVAAATIGAGCIVGVQAAAIVDHGTFSRLTMFQSPAWIAAAPSLDSVLWWPARAALGEPWALVGLLAGALALLAATVGAAAGLFACVALAVAGLQARPAPRGRARPFRVRPPAASLRWKESLLLWRDPWLLSQSLMQILYLLPPALMLWLSYGSDTDRLVILVPVLVMAAGQLAGGLAWLAISGEDAPDLINSAPLASAAVLRAKVEVVALAIAVPLAPFVLALAVASPFVAVVTLLGIGLATAGASAVQYLIRVKGSRSNFRRRQTASRLATIMEALVSISVAAAGGLAAAGSWIALAPLAFAAGIILLARALAPTPA